VTRNEIAVFCATLNSGGDTYNRHKGGITKTNNREKEYFLTERVRRAMLRKIKRQ
jgi:hypothetical protein